MVALYLTTGMFSENNVRSAFDSSFNLSYVGLRPVAVATTTTQTIT